MQDDAAHWPFKVAAGPGDKPVIEVDYKHETKRFSPEEISSMVLTKMKEVAQVRLGVLPVRGAAAGWAARGQGQTHTRAAAGGGCLCRAVRPASWPRTHAQHTPCLTPA